MLVIIGLVVGGVVVGRSLIRQSQINSIETQAGKIGQALNIFRDKYGGTPGEIDLLPWFPQLGIGGGYYCSYPGAAGNVTVLDGLIDTGYEGDTAYAELYAAGLVPMGLPQILQNGSQQPLWNCFQNGMQQDAAFSTKFDNVYARWSTLNNAQSLTYGSSWIPLLTSAEAWAFDTKFDDGVPSTGNIQAGNTAGSNCTSGWSASQYDTGAWLTGSNTVPSCAMYISLPSR